MSLGSKALSALCACLVFAACPSGPSSRNSTSGRDETATRARKAAHIERLLAQRPLAAEAIDGLTEALPGRAWLTEVVFGSGKVRLKGMAPSIDLLADYLSRLGQDRTFEDLRLGASVSKIVQGREWAEFTIEAGTPAGRAVEPAAEGTASDARLAELEKMILPRPEASDALRQIQRLALDAGLQMTKFAPGAEAAAEFTRELPATIEVAGEIPEIGRFLRGLAGLPQIWVVEKFSLKTSAANEPRSPARASITARAYFAL